MNNSAESVTTDKALAAVKMVCEERDRNQQLYHKLVQNYSDLRVLYRNHCTDRTNEVSLLNDRVKELEKKLNDYKQWIVEKEKEIIALKRDNIVQHSQVVALSGLVQIYSPLKDQVVEKSMPADNQEVEEEILTIDAETDGTADETDSTVLSNITTRKQYKCTVKGCHSYLYSDKSLKEHIKVKHGHRNSPRPQCHKIFSSSKTLRTHSIRIHNATCPRRKRINISYQ